MDRTVELGFVCLTLIAIVGILAHYIGFEGGKEIALLSGGAIGGALAKSGADQIKEIRKMNNGL